MSPPPISHFCLLCLIILLLPFSPTVCLFVNLLGSPIPFLLPPLLPVSFATPISVHLSHNPLIYLPVSSSSSFLPSLSEMCSVIFCLYWMSLVLLSCFITLHHSIRCYRCQLKQRWPDSAFLSPPAASPFLSFTVVCPCKSVSTLKLPCPRCLHYFSLVLSWLCFSLSSPFLCLILRVLCLSFLHITFYSLSLSLPVFVSWALSPVAKIFLSSHPHPACLHL